MPTLGRTLSAATATSNLFTHVEATPENLHAGHRAWVLDARRQPGGSLFLEATTALSGAGQQALAGLGPIGTRAAGLPGVFVPTVRSVRWPDTAPATSTRQPVAGIGFGAQPSDVRTPCRQPSESSPARLTRARESQVWPQASPRVGRALAGARGVRVADRAAEIDAYVVRGQALGHGVVIGAATDRA